MEKLLRVTLLVPVKPLDEEELAESNEGMPEDAKMTQEDALDEADAFELGEVVQSLFYGENVREAFAGSNIYVTFDEPTVVSAEFVEGEG